MHVSDAFISDVNPVPNKNTTLLKQTLVIEGILLKPHMHESEKQGILPFATMEAALQAPSSEEERLNKELGNKKFQDSHF